MIDAAKPSTAAYRLQHPIHTALVAQLPTTLKPAPFCK
jgi:hypothetical protein